MTWPVLLDLELLVRSDQLGSMSAAARELGLTQPEASRRLARLESRLDLHLLIRSHTGSHLTKAGELVVEWSHQLLDQATQWQAGVAALHARSRTQLHIAASQTIAEHLAPLWLASYRRAHPEVAIRLDVHNSARVAELVRCGTIAMGLLESPGVPGGLDTEIVGRDRLVVVVSPSHPWRRRRSVTLRDLAATPLVVREPGSGTRETLEQALRGMDCAAPLLELSSNAAVLAAAASGSAPAVVSSLAARGAISDGRLRRVPLAGRALERELRAVWERGTQIDNAAQGFLDMIVTRAGNASGPPADGRGARMRGE